MLMSCTTKIPVLTFAVLDESFSLSVEEIHSVGTINNVETSYFTQLIMLPNDNVSMSVRHLDHVLFAARSNNHVLLFQGRHILTDVRCHYGKPWSPVSPLLANLFMEWLEKQAIDTAPVECKPKFWKQYVYFQMPHSDTEHLISDILHMIQTQRSWFRHIGPNFRHSAPDSDTVHLIHTQCTWFRHSAPDSDIVHLIQTQCTWFKHKAPNFRHSAPDSDTVHLIQTQST